MKVDPSGKDRFAKRIANWINNSKGAQRVLRGINKNPAVFSAVAAFGFAALLRPAAIGLLPFANDKDKKCSQASAVAAGLTELAATAAIFVPLNKCIEKASKSLYRSRGTFYEGNNIALRQFKSVTNRGFKLLFLAPITLLRFSLVKPLMNKLFKPKDKEETKKLQDKYQNDVKRYLEAQRAEVEQTQGQMLLAQVEGKRLDTWA